MTGFDPFAVAGDPSFETNAARLRDEDAAGEFAGVGTTDDGLVTARVDGGRLQAIELDPKAMRKSGDELSRLVLAAVASARADHLAKRADRVAQLGVQPPSPAEIDANLARIQQLVRESHGDMRTVAEQMRSEATDGRR